MTRKLPSTRREESEERPEERPRRVRRNRGEPKLFISFLPDGKAGSREDKGSVPLDVDVEAHIEERTDCEPGLYRIEKKRSGEFSGEVLFYTKEEESLSGRGRPTLSDSNEETDPPLDLDAADVDEWRSPMQRLLSSLKERSGDSAVVIYARRKPDPARMVFRSLCNAEYTAGEVPYDETDLSIDALELAIQKLYGGGRYEIRALENGELVGTVVRNILDPPESKSEATISNHPHLPPAGPSKSAIEEIRDSVSVFKEVAGVLASTRPAAAPLEKETPLETLKDAVALVREVNSVIPNGNGETAGSTVRDWLDGISSIGREFGIGTMLNNLVVFGLNEAARKRAEETGPAAGRSANNGADARGTAEQQIPPPGLQTAEFHTRPSQSAALVLPGGLSVDQLPPPMRVALDRALTVLVAEIRRSESNSDEHETEAGCAALDEFVRAFPESLPIFNEFMQQSSVRLLLFLSALKPEWSNLPDLEYAIGFIDDVRAQWVEQVAANGADVSANNDNAADVEGA